MQLVTDKKILDELSNPSQQSTPQQKFKRVTDPEVLKSLNGDSSTAGSFLQGFTHNFDEYAASLNKGLNTLHKGIFGKESDFFKQNKQYWNRQKKLNELETYKHPYARLGGEVILDPINLTPAGIASKGTKAARIMKSMAGGAGVGYGTMAFKNYGDQSKTAKQKTDERMIGAGAGAVINGIISALTKGKINKIVADDISHEEAQAVKDALRENPEAFGLKKDEAQKANEEISKYFPQPADTELKFKPFQQPQRPAGALGSRAKITDERLRYGIENEQLPMLPNKGGEFILQDKRGSYLLPNKQGDMSLETRLANAQNHPRFKELIERQRDVDAKSTYAPQRLVSPREIRNINVGKGWENDVIPALYEKNYDHDFLLTKGDIKKLESGKIDDDLLRKIETDLETLDNHPEWSKQPENNFIEDKPEDMSWDDWAEANSVFANAGSNIGHSLAGGTGVGTLNAANAILDPKSADENGDGVLTGDELADKFINGFIAGSLGVGAIKVLKHTNTEAYSKVRNYILKSFNPDGTAKDGVRVGMFVGSHPKEIGSFSDVKTGATMREIDDSTAKIISKKDGKASDVLKHDELFDRYPELRDIEVKFEDMPKGHSGKNEDGKIVINKNMSDEEIKSTLLHELQHSIQDKEGWATGGSAQEFLNDLNRRVNLLRYELEFEPDDFIRDKKLKELNEIEQLAKSGKDKELAFEKYKKLWGEQQARATAYRKNMNMNERMSEDWTQTLAREEGAYEEPIVKYDNGNADIIDSLRMSENAPNKKEYASHLKKLAYERINKDWSDISSGFISEVKRLFTNTLSGDYLKRRDAMNAIKTKLESDAVYLHESLQKLPEQERGLLHKYIVGDIDKSKVPDDIKEIGENIRKTVKELTDQIVESGIMSQEAVDEWGKYYLKRLYKKHYKEDKGFAGIFWGKTLEKLYERGAIDEIGSKDIESLNKFLEPLGIDASGYKTIDEFIANNAELLEAPLRDGGIRIKKLPNGKYKIKRDYTFDERTAMGEIRDASITIPETVMRLGTLVEHAKFLKDIQEVDGAVVSDALAKELGHVELSNAGYRQLSKNAKYGVLAGKWVRKDVADDIDAMNKHFIDAMLGEKSVLADAYNNYLILWKKSKTVWNAPAHINNFLSNLFLMQLAGLKYGDMVKGLATVRGTLKNLDRYKEIARKSMLGRASGDELRELEKLQGELKYVLEAENMGMTNKSRLNDITQNTIQGFKGADGAIRKADKFVSDLYQMEDVVNRITAYKILRERGWSKEEAKAGVDSIMPDYTQPLPKGWQFARDTGISPFIAWNYYTVPKILKLMKTKEGALRTAQVLGALGGFSYVMSGISPVEHLPFVDTDMPEWMKGKYIPVGKHGDKIDTLKVDRFIPQLQMMQPVNYARDLASGIPQNLFISATMQRKLYNNRPITYAKKSGADKAYDYAKHYITNFVPLPQEAYNVWDLIDANARSKRRRKSDNVTEPRSTLQSILKLGGVNTISYNRRALKNEQRRQK